MSKDSGEGTCRLRIRMEAVKLGWKITVMC